MPRVFLSRACAAVDRVLSVLVPRLIVVALGAGPGSAGCPPRLGTGRCNATLGARPGRPAVGLCGSQLVAPSLACVHCGPAPAGCGGTRCWALAAGAPAGRSTAALSWGSEPGLCRCSARSRCWLWREGPRLAHALVPADRQPTRQRRWSSRGRIVAMSFMTIWRGKHRR